MSSEPSAASSFIAGTGRTSRLAPSFLPYRTSAAFYASSNGMAWAAVGTVWAPSSEVASIRAFCFVGAAALLAISGHVKFASRGSTTPLMELTNRISRKEYVRILRATAFVSSLATAAIVYMCTLGGTYDCGELEPEACAGQLVRYVGTFMAIQWVRSL